MDSKVIMVLKGICNASKKICQSNIPESAKIAYETPPIPSNWITPFALSNTQTAALTNGGITTQTIPKIDFRCAARILRINMRQERSANLENDLLGVVTKW